MAFLTAILAPSFIDSGDSVVAQNAQLLAEQEYISPLLTLAVGTIGPHFQLLANTPDWACSGMAVALFDKRNQNLLRCRPPRNGVNKVNTVGVKLTPESDTPAERILPRFRRPRSQFGKLGLLYFVIGTVGVVTLWQILATAQTQAEDVHVAARWPAMSETDAGPGRDARLHSRSIIKDVNLVLVPVTVTDDMGRPVTGLEKHNFTVYEGPARQQVQYFSSEDAPISIGILFDVSGSMSDKIQQAREAVGEFLKTANPEDEFFVITFSDRPQLVSDFDSSPENIQSKLMLVAPKGATALHDAIYLGLSKAKSGRYARRALLIISDGGDNHSRYSEREVMTFAREADTPTYAIGIHTAPKAREEEMGSWMLGKMTEATGGLHFTIDRSQDLADVATKIGHLLRNRYVLGYKPDNPVHDGKWRKIKVRLEPPNEVSHLRTYAKTGYYASAR